MPHIVIDKLKHINYPQKVGDVEFLFQAENLIGVKINNTKFLLSIKEKERGYLVKYDKITRPITSYLKKAYLAFAKLNNANILFENIKGIKEKLKSEYLLTINDNLDNIDIVEVGFGSGRHLIHLAKENPTKTLLGIEIHNPSIEQLLKRIRHEKITNIKVINHDARLILSKIPSNKLSAIYVHFPVPWDKKEHRRVINKDFIKEAIRTLKVDGILHLRTDSENYFNYSLAKFLEFDKIKLKVNKNIPYIVSSKYEDRWRKLNKNIYDIIMINIQNSPEIENNFDFSFKKKLTNLDFKPRVFENFVIHIEKVFKINNEKELIRLTMGNFNRPEHLYILNKDKPEYFKQPAKVKDNYLAHLQLKRLFNG